MTTPHRDSASMTATRVGLTLMLILAALVAGVTPAQAVPYGYFRAPWSADIHVVDTSGEVRRLSYDEWRAAGSPAPQLTPVRYVKNAWSSTVYGLITWPNSADDRAVDQVATLSYADFVAAGRPGVQTVDHVPGTSYLTWGSNASQIYAEAPDGGLHHLSGSQWRAAGSPTPTQRPGGFYRAPWSGDIHRVDPASGIRAISYAEWLALGSPTPALTPVRYVSTPWNPNVYAMITWPHRPGDTSVHQIEILNWAQYSAAGRPGVESVGGIPGDRWVRYTLGTTVYHSVAGVLTPVSYDQWRWAGSPAPAVEPAPSPTYIRGILVVNKSLPVPSWYGSGLTPETSSSFGAMQAAASREGLSLFIASGFRSYAHQRDLYARYVATHGQAAADRFSARPGHSEHQTGLALDVNTTSGSFGSTPAGRWVAANAHRFGFIVRYPPGKEHITGYMYEPWHLRYVGVDVATHLVTTGQTLEEYLGVPSQY